MVFRVIAWVDQLIFSSKKNVVISLIVWGFLLNGLCLWSQEFIRHTEADRSLIGWEMYENGNLLVPTLLGSQILTKPPLYYWLSATSVYFFGSGSEFVARLPSLFSSVFFMLGQFFCWYFLTGKLRISALASFALGTSVLFYILSGVAEIDMLFGFLSSMSIAALFFVLKEGGLKWVACLAVFLFLAFLTKGPPVYFFTGGATFCFVLLEWWLNRDIISYKAYIRPLMLAAFSVLLSFVLISFWLIPLAYEVGWTSLSDRFQEEVLSRVVSYSDRERGVFFYVWALFLNTLPWSFFLVLSVFAVFSSKRNLDKSWVEVASPLCSEERVRSFFRYSLCVLWVGFMMLSSAQGKSNRYAFPLVLSLINVSILFSGYCLTPKIFKVLAKGLKLVSFVGVLGSLIFFSIKPLVGVSMEQWVYCMGSVVVVALFVILSSYHKMWRYYPVYMGVIFLVIRLCQGELYATYRNQTRTVKPLAKQITEEVAGRTLYTLEMFERWTLYYGKTMGLKAKRLSPSLEVGRVKDGESSSILLLDFEEEAWRYPQAMIYSNKTDLKRVYAHPSSSAYLLEVPNEILGNFKVLTEFPTHPSIPFYPELESRGLLK